jgi:VWFA-related protein
MRRLLLIGLVAINASPALAAHRVTVSQLEQTLSIDLARHGSDEEIARQIANLQLSERLTGPALDRLANRFPLQSRTALSLELLADQSAFLDPPAAELPAAEPPDAATQQRILDLARGYIVETIPRLPNFFATRTVHRFDDSPEVLHPGDWPVRAGLHLVGSGSRTVTFRDGHEVVDSNSDVKANPDLGLYSYGEFGPILARTLADLIKGEVRFSHWEQTPLGIAAAYRLEVPKGESHYHVHFCCRVNQEYVARQAYGPNNVTRRASETSNPAQSITLQPFDDTPAYHGTLSIDVTTGAILRITIEAELSPGAPIEQASTVVEYGRMQIGDQTYICPVRSLALSVQKAPYAPNGQAPPPPTLLINESTFTQYHRLGSTARMIANGAAADSTESAPIVSENATASAPVPPPAEPSAPAVPPASEPAASAVATPAAPPASADVSPELTMTEVRGVPDVPANSAQPQDTGFSLKITSRLVDVGVVAFDRKGRPVTDLKQEDFEVYDEGRKQEIHYFTAPAFSAPEAAESAPAAAEPAAQIFSNRAAEPTGITAAAPQATGGTILLIDESHIAWNDLNYARGEMLRFLSTVPPNERIGIYSMTGIGFRVLVELTTDHTTVAGRLKAFLPTAQSVSEAHEEERRNRQQLDSVHNVADLNSVNGNHGDAPDAEQPVDPELLTMGSNPARPSLIILAQVARHLAAIPGHKSVVWVSSDNVLADWEDQAVGIDKNPKMIESYAVRAQETMNDAHAAVYPFDVSRLETGAITADMQHASVQLAPATAENAATAASAGGPAASGGVSTRDTGSGRITAQMSQDLHPIQGPVREVAEATGGRTIRRSGDLAAALSGIVQDGEATYQLSFSPHGPADDHYHAITVKLNGRRGITLRYRKGYLFDKDPDTLKARFQQAVWRPTETSDIGVRATVSGNGSTIQLTIAATGLGMEQQAGRWMDKLDIFFIQRDDAGIRARVDGQTLGLRLRPETYQKALENGIPFEHAVEMRPGMASVRVLVVDENSGRMGSVTIPFSALQAAR